MVIEVNLNEKYGIVIERSALSRIGEIINLDRKVLVVTDSGVPRDYAAAVVSACKTPVLVTVEMGEGSKSIETYTRLLSLMLENGLTRGDAVVAVGGGVVGDLSGFVAASYMRGVDFYNVPTTLLSQVDSSVGGKTAVNLSGIKNCVGAFWQPKGVVIDPTVLKTLSPRQFNSGLAEVIKMAATLDKELFVSGGSDHSGLCGGMYETFEHPEETPYFIPPLSSGNTEMHFGELKERKINKEERAKIFASM